VAQQPVLGGLEPRLGGLRPQLQERERDVISKKSMTTKTITATTWVAVEYFPMTRLCSAVR
jgi:hypothetical protein